MPCEFSLSHYEEILEAIKSRTGTATERKDIILTHDIDIFPLYALKTARIESLYNIKSTYYVLLHSEWYNALSPESMKIWKEIASLGHELSLHYDGNYDGDLKAIHTAFRSMLGTESRQISQHLLGITPDLHIPAYLQDRSEFSKLRGYDYLADSGGWFRKGCFCQHVSDKTKKFILVSHPVWWVHGSEPFNKVRYDCYAVTNRAQIFWEGLVNEHRKQKTIQLAA